MNNNFKNPAHSTWFQKENKDDSSKHLGVLENKHKDKASEIAIITTYLISDNKRPNSQRTILMV